MKNDKKINESSIKKALERGLITSQEARQMLSVYLHKSDFTSIAYPSKHVASRSYDRHH